MNQVVLTPEEVAALLQGLSQPEANGSAPPEPAPKPAAPPDVRVQSPRRPGVGFPQISHGWAAIPELEWPQLLEQG